MICLSKGKMAFSYLFFCEKIGLAVCISVCNMAPAIEEIAAREGPSDSRSERKDA